MTKQTIRGIDHVGVTVTDIEAATTFLVEAFGAQVIYQSFGTGDKPYGGPALERDTGVATGTVMRAQRMIRIGHGPDIELFEMHADDQRPAARGSDIGVNHIAFYVDDMPAAITRFERAGGTMMSKPIPILFEAEQGEGNVFCYGRTPWGMSIEFIAYPGEMGFEKEPLTPLESREPTVADPRESLAERQRKTACAGGMLEIGESMILLPGSGRDHRPISAKCGIENLRNAVQ